MTFCAPACLCRKRNGALGEGGGTASPLLCLILPDEPRGASSRYRARAELSSFITAVSAAGETGALGGVVLPWIDSNRAICRSISAAMSSSDICFTSRDFRGGGGDFDFIRQPPRRRRADYAD